MKALEISAALSITIAITLADVAGSAVTAFWVTESSKGEVASTATATTSTSTAATTTTATSSSASLRGIVYYPTIRVPDTGGAAFGRFDNFSCLWMMMLVYASVGVTVRIQLKRPVAIEPQENLTTIGRIAAPQLVAVVLDPVEA